MKPKIKLGIPDLKVQSFITDISQKKQAEVKGGLPYTCLSCDAYCSNTFVFQCGITDSFEMLCKTGCDCTVERYTCPDAC